MPDLLFISDNPKVVQIKDLLQPSLKLEIGVTAHIEGLREELHGHQPSVLCIQEQVAGTGAEEIANLIREEQGEGTSLFVLLRAGDDGAVPAGPCFKHAIDLSLPVDQLAKSILRVVLKPAFKLRWNDIYIPRDRHKAATAPPGREEAEPTGADAAPAKAEIPAELLKAFEHNYHSRHRGRWLKYAAASLAACLAVGGWQLSSNRLDQGGSVSSPPESPSRPAAKSPAVPPALPAKKSIPRPPAPSPVAIAPKTPSASRTAAAPAATMKLPSFIPAKGRDNAYSRRKPNWERYADTNYEFRILRSGSRIKALQVLASKRRAISEAFFKSALAEVAGTGDYRITSHEQKDGFSIRRGKVGNGAGIVRYDQGRNLRAFVISLP
ncbi:hypothetical protein F6V30_11390 [Oryzomonas sagensis]|uniref:Response regulatory domain-containing protein n=1 Tax=Oryzomonas sagensis TaxID=2603857 RepID=A0ABQ6TMH0_9BACT|nr:hypothetical protein [Oryzomonas sagensis]KAB0669410.1 hypothetical protein F6V30_11390 [Oryzomonas sagensis]